MDSRWKSNPNPDSVLRGITETERDFGRSSDNICKEYVARPMPEMMAN